MAPSSGTAEIGLGAAELEWEGPEPAGTTGGAPFLAPRVGPLDVALFATQMRALVGAGIPVNEALGLVARATREHAPALAAALFDVRAGVEEGRTLADGFRRHQRVFGRLCVEMIATGEATGTLEQSLGDIADDCEYRHRHRSTVLSALVEPALIVVLGLGVSYLLLTVTVPQFKTLYASLTRSGLLPLPTRTLISVSDALTSTAGVLGLVALVAVAAALAAGVSRSDAMRYRFHCLLLRAPLVGELALLDAVSRAARTIAVVYRSVGELPMALELAVATTSNMRVAEALAEAGDDVYEGKMVWEAMRDTGILPELCISMTKSGEESGRLDTLLFKLAETFETRVRYRQERLLTLLRYGLLIVMGGFVLGLMLALYLPIFSLVDQLNR